MASPAASLAVSAGYVTGPWSWLLLAGASVLDSQYILPGLMGDSKKARSPKLAGVPTGSNEPGAPRIWAIGNRVRVPLHVLWQSTKVRESTPNQKGASGIVQRRVFVDALLALNDRETAEMRQLIGNGKLLVWKSRNLVQVTTDQMSAAASGSQVVITMADQTDPDLSEYFEVGDPIKLTGWDVVGASPSINTVYWEVAAVTGHSSSAPSTLTLNPVQGQTVTGVNCTAGQPYAPATIERVDDAEVGGPAAEYGGATNATGQTRWLFVQVREGIFNIGDQVVVSGYLLNGTNQFGGVIWRVQSLGPGLSAGDETAIFVPVFGVPPAQIPRVSLTNVSSTDKGRIEFAVPQVLARSLFPASFDPATYFYSGTDTQGEDPLIVADKGTGNVPAYRGVAYQGLDEFEVTQFGNGLPFSMEAIIDVDRGMSWPEAVRAVLEWGGVPSDAIDVGGVDADPFFGFYLRGSAPVTTAIQPLLVAKQIVAQDRDGVLSFFQVENADVVSLENGAVRTCLGARLDGEPASDDKISRTNAALEDLPTSVGIRHQDPDNAYAPGYQTYGLRHPSGVTWQNVREVDLSNLALSRKQARNLATTLLRRNWVNSTQVQMTLDGRYIDLLENDLLTVTDDDGNDLTVRITQLDVGANFVVQVTAVVEDVALEVSGSAVQPVAGTYQRPLVTPAVLDVAVLDIPALDNADADAPTLLLAATPQPGSTFQGCQVFESADGGNTWVPIGTISQGHTMGYVTSTVPGHAPAETFGSATLTYDTTNTLTVELTDGGYTAGLASCTTIEAEAGVANWAAIQDLATGRWEIIAFTTVTPTGGNVYEISGLLRGLRGTWAQAGLAKPAGGQFVLLSSFDLAGLRHRVGGSISGASRSYRFVPVGQTLEATESVGITPTWRSVSPHAPRRLTKTIGGSPYDTTFETENETRFPLPLGSVGPYGMDESFEEYVFTIYDPTGNVARRVKRISTRTVNGVAGSPNLRDRFVSYTAAEQTADGYTPSGSTSFVVDVQQVGDYGTSTSYKRTV